MGIRDDEFDAAQAAAGELAQELGPEDLGLRRANLQTHDFAAAVAIDSNSNDHRNRDDAALGADLHRGASSHR
jgi:hypothetical protein